MREGWLHAPRGGQHMGAGGCKPVSDEELRSIWSLYDPAGDASARPQQRADVQRVCDHPAFAAAEAGEHAALAPVNTDTQAPQVPAAFLDDTEDVAAAKAARAAAVEGVGGVQRTAPVDEVNRAESPSSIAMKSLELDGTKAADLKVQVEANEQALNDLQNVQSQAGEIAEKAAEATPEALNEAAGKVDELLEEGVTIANRKTEEGGFLFGGEQAKSEPFEAKKNADGKITEVNYRGSSEVGVEQLGSGFSVTPAIPGENTGATGATGAVGLVKDSRTGGDLFGNLISLRDNLLANEKEAIVERDIPALKKDAEHLIQHFGEVSATQMMLDTVKALAADIETTDGQPMSTVDKLGNIRYALHQALTDNRNFIQQDLLQPIE